MSCRGTASEHRARQVRNGFIFLGIASVYWVPRFRRRNLGRTALGEPYLEPHFMSGEDLRAPRSSSRELRDHRHLGYLGRKATIVRRENFPGD